MTDINQAAGELGMDHSEAESNGKPFPRIHSGRQVALALGISEDLTGEQYVALLNAYQGGRSAYY